MIRFSDVASFIAIIIGFGLVFFKGDVEGAQWMFIAGLLFIAASNANDIRLIRRAAIDAAKRRHPAGKRKDLDNG